MKYRAILLSRYDRVIDVEYFAYSSKRFMRVWIKTAWTKFLASGARVRLDHVS